nr:MAG TPA: hypothetical protein [Caudoviricetes sp.]
MYCKYINNIAPLQIFLRFSILHFFINHKGSDKFNL